MNYRRKIGHYFAIDFDTTANSLIYIPILCDFDIEILILVNMLYVNRLTKYLLILVFQSHKNRNIYLNHSLAQFRQIESNSYDFNS